MAQNEADMTAAATATNEIENTAAAASITGQEHLSHAETAGVNTTEQSAGEGPFNAAASATDENMQTDSANTDTAPPITAQSDLSPTMPDSAVDTTTAGGPLTSDETMDMQQESNAQSEMTSAEGDATAVAETGTAEPASNNMTDQQTSSGANDTEKATAAGDAAGQDLLSFANSMTSQSNAQDMEDAAGDAGTHDPSGADASETAPTVQQQTQPAGANGHAQPDVIIDSAYATAAVPEADGGEQTTEQLSPPDVSTTTPHRADSDIEEGEELSSPPRRSSHFEGGGVDQDLQHHRRSPSPVGSINRALRSRDGRSRSPARQRRGSPVRDGQPPPPKRTYNRDELFKVYIGGLPEKTEFADLQDCFSQFGEIGHIELKTGYAFIEFVTQEAAADAIETYHEGHFLGKMIKVEASKSATTQQKSIDEGTCFTCCEHGHFAKYCPQDPRNAHRGPRGRGGRDRSPGRGDRREPRIRDDRDRHYSPREERNGGGGRRERGGAAGRDDARRYRPGDRDDRREPDRRRDRDAGPVGSINGGRYIEPNPRDAQRGPPRNVDPAAIRDREFLDQQRDRERQLRRLAEMDPNSVPPPAVPVGGYPPRGSMDNGGPYPPPGAIPPSAGSPYYPPYGTQAFPPPPAGVPLPGAPYGMPPGIPGPSASPPIPPYPARGGESRMPPYNNSGAPYPPTVPPYGRDASNGPGDPYYRSGDAPGREGQNGNYGARDAPYDRREGFDRSAGERYGGLPPRPPFPQQGDAPYPRRGDERPPMDARMPPGGPPPPFFYDRPGPGWGGPPGAAPDRALAGSPPFDSYGRPPSQSYQASGPPHEYDSYRPGASR